MGIKYHLESRKNRFSLIIQTVKDKSEVRIAQLGTFKVVERKARVGVNLKTGAKISIPATKVPTFKAAKPLKDIVNGS